MNPFKDQVVTVAGSGESGLGALRLLGRLGAKRRCTSQTINKEARDFFKKEKITFEEGNSVSFLDKTRYLIVSPGVKPESPLVKHALRRHIPVISEVSLAARFAQGPWLAITGTNGKTTTARLLWEMLRLEGPCDLCGNIGKSFSRSVFFHPEPITRVVELSSFQLHFSDHLGSRMGAILNLQPNHLDWHPNEEDYFLSKLRLAVGLRTGGELILNADDPGLMERTEPFQARDKEYFSSNEVKRGVFVRDGCCFESNAEGVSLAADLGNSLLKGAHNHLNISAAVLMARRMGVSKPSIQQAIDRFKPIAHRLEWLGEVEGIRFVNDSKSSNLESTLAALRSMPERVFLIAGGRAKQNDFTSLNEWGQKLGGLFLYGESASLMERQLKGLPSFRARRFDAAVNEAIKRASAGDTVLLSPMAASFDQFKSFEERGNAFKKIFKALKRKEKDFFD
jgi:UDP-N-acetylmuramoylalanine--D-glutamate ligase